MLDKDVHSRLFCALSDGVGILLFRSRRGIDALLLYIRDDAPSPCRTPPAARPDCRSARNEVLRRRLPHLEVLLHF